MRKQPRFTLGEDFLGSVGAKLQGKLVCLLPPRLCPWAVTPTLAALENKAMMGPHPGSIKSWSQKMRLRSSFCPYLATLSYYYSTKDEPSQGQRKPLPSSPCPALRIWAILISKMKSAAVGIKRWGFLVEGEEVKLSVLVVLNLYSVLESSGGLVKNILLDPLRVLS